MLETELNRLKQEIVQIRCESPDLNRILVEFLSRKSKFIRSYIGFLLLKSFGIEPSDRHYKILKVSELIHNSSLIHDDIIDNSLFRRGGKSLNSEFGADFAVISGDFLITTAVEELLELDNNEILKSFLETIKNMCLGETQQHFMKDKKPTLDEYLRKTKYKTAYLFSTSIKNLGLPQDAIDYANYYGMAFQIRNDLDNYINDGDDHTNGIFTAPYILGGDKKEAIEKTFDLIHNYCIKGEEILIAFPQSIYREELIKLIEGLSK